MSYLKKYRLTPAAQNKKEIFIAANPQTGDKLFHEEVAKLTDRKAEVLMSRKDGRGADFVELVPTSSAKPSTKKD